MWYMMMVRPEIVPVRVTEPVTLRWILAVSAVGEISICEVGFHADIPLDF